MHFHVNLPENFARINSLLRTAVELFPSLSSRTLTQQDRQYNISKFAGIPSKAASASLQCGEHPYNAVQLLEIGRGVLADLQIQIRSDISILRESYPSLANRFEELRYQLDVAMSSIESKSGATVNDFRNSAKEFDALVAEIRELKGFEQFLKGPTQYEVMAMAEQGPIVLVYVSNIRSDAIIVTRNTINNLELVSLTPTDLDLYSKLFLHAIDKKLSDYLTAKRDLNKVLEWLWNVLAEPVLTYLKFKPISVDKHTSWPRIWSVRCGLLNIFPIHAAGYHDSLVRSGQTVIDRAISSYTSTIKALSYSREHITCPPAQVPQKILVLGMSTTPEHRDLAFVQEEIKRLRDLLPLDISVTVDLEPTRENVIPRLQEYHVEFISF